jgi:hypothetical protein
MVGEIGYNSINQANDGANAPATVVSLKSAAVPGG